MQTRIAALLLIPAGLAVLSAQNPTTLKVVPVTPTSAASGQQMFETYCATCHGRDGRGNGPAAPALKKTPADLTMITVRHNGKFPEIDIQQAISGSLAVEAHGSREMPIWGDLFKSMDAGSGGVVQLRVDNLTSYIKSLQRK